MQKRILGYHLLLCVQEKGKEESEKPHCAVFCSQAQTVSSPQLGAHLYVYSGINEYGIHICQSQNRNLQAAPSIPACARVSWRWSEPHRSRHTGQKLLYSATHREFPCFLGYLVLLDLQLDVLLKAFSSVINNFFNP